MIQKLRRRQRTENIDGYLFFSSPCFTESALKLTFKAFHTHHETTHACTASLFRPRLLLTDCCLHCLKCLKKGWGRGIVCGCGCLCVCACRGFINAQYNAFTILGHCCWMCFGVCVYVRERERESNSSRTVLPPPFTNTCIILSERKGPVSFSLLASDTLQTSGRGSDDAALESQGLSPGYRMTDWTVITHANNRIPPRVTEACPGSPSLVCPSL